MVRIQLLGKAGIGKTGVHLQYKNFRCMDVACYNSIYDRQSLELDTLNPLISKSRRQREHSYWSIATESNPQTALSSLIKPFHHFHSLDSIILEQQNVQQLVQGGIRRDAVTIFRDKRIF